MSMAGVAAPLADGSNGDGPSIDLDGNPFLLSSSGTTGMPKLVRITHRAMAATVQLVPAAVGFGPDDTMLVALPLFHAGGLTVATIPLVVPDTLSLATMTARNGREVVPAPRRPHPDGENPETAMSPASATLEARRATTRRSPDGLHGVEQHGSDSRSLDNV
jgi:acyl-CoA synthetase (AMP-forming)/AMP-acid ligase II